MSFVEKLVVVMFIAAIVGVYLLEAYLIVDFAVGALRARKKSYAIARRPALVGHLLAVMGVLCFLYAYFVEPYWVEVKTVHIQTDKLSKAHIRLVHISDTHCYRNSRNEKKLIEVVKATRPDVIVFTGDALLFNHPALLPVFKEAMKSLDANLGKFVQGQKLGMFLSHRAHNRIAVQGAAGDKIQVGILFPYPGNHCVSIATAQGVFDPFEPCFKACFDQHPRVHRVVGEYRDKSLFVECSVCVQ